MKRRGLFAFLGVSPMAVAGAALASVRKDDAPPTDAPTISFMRDDHQVRMACGNDDHLWIKAKDGRWRRVVTE